VSLYNNAGLISKDSEEIAIENAENCRCRQPHCRLVDAPSLWNSPNILINLLSPESSHRATVLPLKFWVCLHSHFCGVVGSERRIFSATPRETFRIYRRSFCRQNYSPQPIRR